LNFKEILELIDKVADRGIGSVEIERAGLKVRIEGKRSETYAVTQSFSEAGPASAAPQYPMLAPPPGGGASEPALSTDEESDASLHIITAPIVGTFYRSPNPESEFFVNVGDRVTKGSVLCIIEAMKLMNEIEADFDGEVVRIYPQNAQPVEYGEKLFAVRP
jgi:acetyl-CoA carboxylase biotin carboxyl carrier protein